MKNIVVSGLVFSILFLSCTKPLNSSNHNPVFSDSEVVHFKKGIHSIFQDSQERYWIGSHEEGLCLYDGKTMVYYNVESGLCHNQIRTIQEDENGLIWFETGAGICSFDGTEFTSHQPSEYNPESEKMSVINNLWFGYGNSPYIVRYNGKKLEKIPLPVPTVDNSNSSYAVTAVSKSREDRVWIATYEGIFSFNGQTVTSYNELLSPELVGGQLHIRAIFEDSKGNVWIGNNGIGVICMQGDTAYNFSDDKGLISKTSLRNSDYSPPGTLEHVFAITEDKSGNIWFGDRDNGAWVFDGQQMQNIIIDSSLNTQHIWSIYEDQSGNLFCTMSEKGVYLYNGKKFNRIY